MNSSLIFFTMTQNISLSFHTSCNASSLHVAQALSSFSRNPASPSTILPFGFALIPYGRCLSALVSNDQLLLNIVPSHYFSYYFSYLKISSK